MNKAIISHRRSIITVLVVAALVLTAAAWLRSAEYDEQYTLFVTAGPARPVWPAHAFAAGDVRTLQAGHAGFAAIAHELRTGDVHPPLYFWLLAAWRGGGGRRAVRGTPCVGAVQRRDVGRGGRDRAG